MFRLAKYYLLKPFIAWIFIFQVFKTFFILYQYNAIVSESWAEILKVYSQAIKLDISSIAYILIVPFLLMITQYFWSNALPKKVNQYYHYVLLIFISVLNVVDIIIYNYWASKISLKALSFLSMPDQVLAATGLTKIFMGLAFIALHFFIGKFLLDKFALKKKISFKKSWIVFIVFTLLSAIALIVGIRGGVQNIPINQSEAYYSKNNTLNVAGVNPFWNFMNVIVQNQKYLNQNPYQKLGNDKAEKYVNDLFFVEKDSTIKLFEIERPNIVFLTLEGVNANVFKAFGNQENITPFMDSLFRSSYLFTQVYAAGFRSDQGLVAMLGGFPPAPVSSIAAQPEKFIQLPSLVQKLHNESYSSSFFTGVEPEFGNLKSYLMATGFEKLIDIKDFPKQERTQGLGVPDEFLFQKFTAEMKAPKEPFFSMIFTSTTHEPYDMPFNNGVSDERQRYLNTVSYLDSALIKNINEWKKYDWYKNTIFVLTSDHAHFHPGNYDVDANERYQVPLAIFGEPLKNEFVGARNNNIYSQLDIPKTVLKQLDIESQEFVWSKNMMNPFGKHFAFYTFVEGYILKTDGCNNGWEYRYDKPVGQSANKNMEFCQEEGQAFLQKLYDVYLAY